MKSIPEEFILPICRALKQQCMALSTVLKMSAEDRLKLFSQMEGNEHLREMFESKPFEELSEDMEIQEMLNGLDGTLTNDIYVIEEALKILESGEVKSN